MCEDEPSLDNDGIPSRRRAAAPDIVKAGLYVIREPSFFTPPSRPFLSPPPHFVACAVRPLVAHTAQKEITCRPV
jgi:hypothetical protein